MQIRLNTKCIRNLTDTNPTRFKLELSINKGLQPLVSIQVELFSSKMGIYSKFLTLRERKSTRLFVLKDKSRIDMYRK